MTCTIGYVDGEVVLIGADSASTSSDGSFTLLPSSKLWTEKNMTIGFCGNYSLLTFIKHCFKWPLREKESHEKYLAKSTFKLMHDIQKQFQKAALNEDWQLLIAIENKLFKIYSDGNVEPVKTFTTIGSGGDLAMACLVMQQAMPLTSWEKMENAFITASQLNSSVKAPYEVLYSMKTKTPCFRRG
jgi:ATP-dependent protease HslVU (ClpYQ) peptidase subunit